MDAIEYLNTIVEPTIEELAREPADKRRAFLACVVTYHTVDYLASQEKKSKGNLANCFAKENPDFALVDRVAHAFKHVRSGDKDSKIKPPLEGASVISRPPARAGAMVCGLSRLGDTTGGVMVWGENGPDLLRAVRRAATFLRDRLG